MYHSGIQANCNILLKISKTKQSSGISEVVERECIELTRKLLSREALVYIRCLVLEHVLTRTSFRVCIFISTN